MLMKAAERMIRCLVKKEIIDPFLYDVYLYGCETVLYTIVSTAGLIVTGILLQYTWETIILVGVFYLNQSLGGGFHANTHIRCFFTMLLGLICAFFLIDLHLPRWSLIVIGAGSVGILLYFPLVLHVNKQHLENNASFFIKRSRIITFIQAAMLLFITFLPCHRLGRVYLWSLALCAISRGVAGISQQKHHNNIHMHIEF